MPLAKRDFPVVAPARNAHRPAVLLAAADKVWERVRRCGVVELTGGLVVPGTPGFSGVDADERALVADQQNNVGEVRIDPQILIVVAAGRAAKAGPGFAAVRGAHRHNGGAVNHVGILRIHARDGQIAATDAERGPRVRGDASPVFAGIIRAVNPNAWSVGGHRSVEAARLARRNGYVHLNDALWQAVSEGAPSLTAVGGFENSASRAAVLIAVFPRAEAYFPERRIYRLGIRGIDLHI